MESQSKIEASAFTQKGEKSKNKDKKDISCMFLISNSHQFLPPIFARGMIRCALCRFRVFVFPSFLFCNCLCFIGPLLFPLFFFGCSFSNCSSTSVLVRFPFSISPIHFPYSNFLFSFPTHVVLLHLFPLLIRGAIHVVTVIGYGNIINSWINS